MCGVLIIMKKKKVIHLEVIRIFALFCIVYNHIGYVIFMNTENILKVTVSLALSILCKIGVPLFFMISGALLLGREETWKEVYKKRVLRIVEVIVLFTALRFFYECYVIRTRPFSSVQLVKSILTGNILHPYWFLYAYLSILLLLPILRIIIKNLDEQGMKNLLLLIVIFFMIIPLKALVVKQEWQVSLILDEKICYMFLGYFIEHKLQKSDFSLRNMTLALGGTFAGIFISFWLVVKPHINGGEYAAEMIPLLSMFLACMIFYLLRGASFRFTDMNVKIEELITAIGSCVFGVYLIEDYLRAIMVWLYGRRGLYIDDVNSCVLSTVIVVLMGIPIVYFLKKLPIIKKLI